MPAIWKRAVQKIGENSPNVNKYAVATAALQKAGDLKPGTRTATAKGIKRGKMTEAQRQKTPAKAMTISGKTKRPHLGRAGRAEGGQTKKITDRLPPGDWPNFPREFDEQLPIETPPTPNFPTSGPMFGGKSMNAKRGGRI